MPNQNLHLAVSNVLTIADRRKRAQALIAKGVQMERVESVQADLGIARSLLQDAAACTEDDPDKAVVLAIAALERLPRRLLRARIARAAATRNR